MKKIVITIIIFLFTVIVTSYAGISANNDGTTSQYGAFFGENTSSNNPEGDSGSSGLFRSPANGPGGRPDSGGGIGQEAPIGDGLIILTACCVMLLVVKIHKRKRKKN